MLAPIRCAARAWLALAIVAGSSSAHAAHTTAITSGMIFGARDGQTEVSPALAPVRAGFDYTQPPYRDTGGRISAVAEAQAGLLKSRASLSVLNAPADLNYGYYNLAEGSAQFQDEWILFGQPLDTPGRLRVSVRFAGHLVEAVSGVGTPSGFGQLTFDMTSVAANENVVDGLRQHWRIDDGSIDQTQTLELDFLYGRRIIVAGYLTVRAEISAPGGTRVVTGSSTADFSHTAALTRLEVWDAASGRYGAAFQLQTGAPTLYPFQAPVPEPGAVGLYTSGLSLLGLRAAISRRRRPSAPAGA